MWITTAADAISWQHTGLVSNTQYTFQVCATNNGVDSSKTTNYSEWTLIQACTGLTFSGVAMNSISVASTNTPSNLTSSNSGLQFAKTTAPPTSSTWQHNNTPWVSSSLSPNTQYAFTGQSRNGESVTTTAVAGSKYTLIEPVADLAFSAVGQNAITVASTNVPSNLASGTSGLQFSKTTAPQTFSGWQPNNNPWTSSSLLPNTLYAFTGQSRNGESVTMAATSASKYTLIEPVASLAFSSVGLNAIAVASSNVPSNLSSGTSGLLFVNTTVAQPSGWQQNNNPWTSLGLSPNTQYAFTGQSRNSVSVTTTAASTSKYTQIEAVAGLAFSAIGQTAITVVSTNTPSNLSSGTSGLQFANTTVALPSAWQPNNNPWTSSVLTPNTQYSFSGQSRNGESVTTTSASASKYTLCGPPSIGNNISCDKSVGTPYIGGTTFTFSNPAGFGAGTHGGGAYKSSKFKYAWNSNATYEFLGTEADWSTGLLGYSPTGRGSYYLHLESFNAESLAGGTLDYGPYLIDADPPVAEVGAIPNVDRNSNLTVYEFTVLYSDDTAVNVGTLDSLDIRVMGPGLDVLATFVSSSPDTNAELVTATYRITPPGGTWDVVDEGDYSVSIELGQVTDTVDNPVAAHELHVFKVDFAPTATLVCTASPTVNGAVTVTMTLSEAAVIFQADIEHSPNAGISDFTGGDTSYSFSLVPSGSGEFTFSCWIPAGQFTDDTGTYNLESNTVSRAYDSIAPTVSSVSSSLANGTYSTGQIVPVLVTFSEPVTYSAGAGSAQLQLETGTPDRQAVYSGGSGTAVLTFNYTVTAGDASLDLEYLSTGALTLTAPATLMDAATNNAALTLPTLYTVNSLGGSKAIVIDTMSLTYTVSGTVTVGGVGLEGVTLSGLPGPPVTIANGAYTATVIAGFGATVTPTLAGYTFAPLNMIYTNVTGNQTGQDYTATVVTYTISGTATVDGVGLGGVTISGLPGNPVTNGSGVYTATVDYGFSGTATPMLAGYTFAPVSKTYTSVTGNQTAQDYTATAITYTISGMVAEGGVGLEGVTILGLPGNLVTNASGVYMATVNYGFSGTATPTLAGYTFAPVNTIYTNVTSNQSGQNYAATVSTYTISGTVTVDGVGLAGVTISGLPGNPVTIGDGTYIATVHAGFSGTATPTLTDYTFAPVTTTYTSVASTLTGQDYVATVQVENELPVAGLAGLGALLGLIAITGVKRMN